MNDTNQKESPADHGLADAIVAVRSRRLTTKTMHKDNLKRQDIRNLANAQAKKNVAILLMMRLKHDEMFIPLDILMTLHFTTFATAIGVFSQWGGIHTLDQSAQEPLCRALDGFSALAIKGAIDEIQLDYGKDVELDGSILSHEMRAAFAEVQQMEPFAEDDGFPPRSPWDRN